MITVGRLCVKTAGRDAGKKCVVVQQIDRSYVIIDGETRRRKCNISHLEPLAETVEIRDGADHNEVSQIFKSMGIDLIEKKPRQPTQRPRQVRAAQRKALAPKTEEKSSKTKAAAPKQPVAKPAVKETKLEKAAAAK
jgi:large subunit ribosomal protein L14e